MLSTYGAPPLFLQAIMWAAVAALLAGGWFASALYLGARTYLRYDDLDPTTVTVYVMVTAAALGLPVAVVLLSMGTGAGAKLLLPLCIVMMSVTSAAGIVFGLRTRPVRDLLGGGWR